MPPAVPRQPAWSKAIPLPGTARYTGMQSATVTVSSMPGEVVTQPSMPSIWSHPPAGTDGAHVGAVDLVAQHDGGEPGHSECRKGASGS